MKRTILAQPEQRTRHSAIWLAIAAGAIMAVGVLALWQVVDRRAHEHAILSMNHAVRMNTLLIRQDADNRFLALGRLANRSVTDSHLSRLDWEADAKQYLADMPGFITIQGISPELQTRWAVVDDQFDGALASDLAAIPAIQAALPRAQEGGGQVFSSIVSIGNGNAPIIAVFAPVFHHGQYDGVIAALIEPGRWLESVIGELQSNDQHVLILLQNHEVYRFGADGDTADPEKTQAHAFNTHGLAWLMQVTPTRSFLSAGHADASSLVLIVGLLLSGLTAAVVYFGIAARHRSHQFHDIALQLATLFRNLPGMAYRRNKTPGVPMAFVSEGCRALSGFPREVFASGEKDWLDIIHTGDRKRVVRSIETAFESGEPFEVSYRITDAAGDTRWMWERGRMVPSEVNHEVHLEGFVTDITGQRSAESEAREHREHLAHVDRLNLLGEMATGIAHEINQPLTAISLFVQAAARMASDKQYDKFPEIFDKLTQHAHRASAVIERMQNLARRRESARTIISCEKLIGEVVRLADAEAHIRDMTIEVHTEPGLPDVSVDSVQIQQVTLNLLRNGMESMQSVRCENGNVIGLRARRHDDGSIEFAVIDSGAGVADSAVDKLFAPFSTTKKSGMGMGLSISRAIVTAHGGRLDFCNNEEAGATFFFTLPPVESEGTT